MDTVQTAHTFVRSELGEAPLGDKRLRDRLMRVGERVIAHPAGSLPEATRGPHELKAAYRLMNHPRVTHDAILQRHRQRTQQRIHEHPGVVLLVQDTTELDYTGNAAIDDLGQIGQGTRQGYQCHNVLAVVPETRDVLGLCGQILHRRAEVPPNETRAQKRARKNRESRLWKRASQSLDPPPQPQQQVEVCDRGADLFEYLDHMDQQGRWFVVRSKEDRRLRRENQDETQPKTLHAAARAMPAMTERTVEVAGSPQQPGRTATLAVSWQKMTIQPPARPRGEHRQQPLEVWVVRAVEIDPPEEVSEPLEWILLTNVPVECEQDAVQRLEWYEARWVVEEYHKVLKTGCRIEDPQFTTRDALEPIVALHSIVAVYLLNLRDRTRDEHAPSRPAKELFPVDFVRVLSAWRYEEDRDDLTQHEFCYALARLGGHQNRKSDGHPGWITLWRGWTQLAAMVQGAYILDKL